MKKLQLILVFLFSISISCFSQLQSPDDFLPHKIGEQFTPHYMLVDYMQHVASNSPNAQLVQYGETNEKRPLILLYISTPENLAQLDAIRENNLKKTGMIEGDSDPALDKAIVWISCTVHGNEASGAESSMPTAYALADPNNTQTQAWLQNTIVILDPTINPDGYSRYTHWYRRFAHNIPNPDPRSSEHSEPWPGGRVNHYYFDLNRDWAWQTQVESQHRLKIYHQWMPHIHVDLHEQGYNSPYYFAPAARPYHQYITDWQADFQKEIGQNHAKYFDQNGWLYFTRQVFDLLYPSYGDTYPIFNGAIGMTYEQAGGGSAGRAIKLANGDTLRLIDRINHHHTTSLSTIEISSINSGRLIQNFEKFYSDNINNPQGEYKTYIIKGSNPTPKLKAFCELMDKNHIQYGKAQSNSAVNVYDYQTGEEKRMNIEANDLVISAYQPKAVLAQTLLDPNTFVEDSMTYDITAWSLPYAYGLEAYASTQRVNVNTGYEFSNYSGLNTVDPNTYAYLAKWEAMSNAKFLAGLLKNGVRVRYATQNFKLNNIDYAPGTLVITRADNRKMGARFHQIIKQTADQYEQEIDAVQSGLVQEGWDFGSGTMRLIDQPNIAVLTGTGTSSYSYGQIWYYFEQDIDFPFDAIPADALGRTDLSPYNILIMPEGFYRVGSSEASKISSWVSGGGRLIALGTSVRKLQDKEGFSLSRYASESAKNEAKRRSDQEQLDNRFHPFAGSQRRSISNYNPGSIVQLDLDETHPLAFGLYEPYFTLKTNSLIYEPLKGAWNVGRTGKDPIIKGFMGYKLKQEVKQSVTFAVENKGGGAVIYLIDNPLFRSFWENGKMLFSNALFFAGQ